MIINYPVVDCLSLFSPFVKKTTFESLHCFDLWFFHIMASTTNEFLFCLLRMVSLSRSKTVAWLNKILFYFDGGFDSFKKPKQLICLSLKTRIIVSCDLQFWKLRHIFYLFEDSTEHRDLVSQDAALFSINATAGMPTLIRLLGRCLHTHFNCHGYLYVIFFIETYNLLFNKNPPLIVKNFTQNSNWATATSFYRLLT